jgi:hypothetical protein
MRPVEWLFAVGATLFISGIGFVVVGARPARNPTAAAQPSVPLVPIASVKQIMNAIVEPGSTAVFSSVSTTISERGVEEKAPRSDDEWAAVGDGAAALAEAGNLLMMNGRAVDQQDWMTMAKAMIAAAQQTLKAVEAKDAQALFDAGGALYVSCDECHKQYQR